MNFALSAQAESIPVSITIDDFGMEEVGAYTAQKIDEGILAALHSEKIRAMAFVCGKRIDSPEGKQRLKLWDQAGHAIANHSYSHLNLNSPKVSAEDYIKDLEKNWPIVAGYKNSVRFFRFPFLKEGLDAPERDVMRSYLEKNHIKNGAVTIDASDWFISDRLRRAIKGGRKDLTGYSKFYIAHMLDRVKYYDGLSKELFGRSIKHTLLIHHNVLNGLFLKDLLVALREQGVQLINASDAYDDSVYQELPMTVLPAGESLLWSLAKEKDPNRPDLRYPAEDGAYLEGEMKKLEL